MNKDENEILFASTYEAHMKLNNNQIKQLYEKFEKQQIYDKDKMYKYKVR